MGSKEQGPGSVTVNHEEQTNRATDKTGALGKASVGADKPGGAAKGGENTSK